MLLNEVDVREDLILRFLNLSDLPGSQHPGVKQEEFVSKSKAAGALPDWMYSSGIDYFDRDSLIKENRSLAGRLPIEIPWLMGEYTEGVFPGRVDPERLILIAYNILKDYSAAIYLDEDELRLIAMDQVDGKTCWVTIYDRFEDFLTDLGV